MNRSNGFINLFALLLFLGTFSPGYFSAQALANDRPIVAVFDMQGTSKKFRPGFLRDLSAYLAAKLAEGGYQVIPQEQIRQRLRKQKSRSHKSCFDQSCQIRLGRELAAQKSLASRILRIGRSCKVTATMYDLSRSATELAATAGGACDEDSLLAALEKVAEKLCQPLLARKRESKKAISDFDKVLQSAKRLRQQKDRVRQAWLSVAKMAKDAQLPTKTRAELLKKFLDEFSRNNPYQKEAQALLVEVFPGELKVQTTPPDAIIKQDGITIGRSPLSRKLNAGTYQLRAEKDGYQPAEQSIVLDPGQHKEISLVLKDVRPAELVVSSKPDNAQVEVYREDKLIREGNTPFSDSLPAGTYRIQVQAKNLSPQEQTVTLQAGQEKKLALTLRKTPPGILLVQSQPKGAEVVVSQKKWSHKLGNTPVRQKIRPGRYRVSASLSGFEQSQKEVEITTGSHTELQFTLEKHAPISGRTQLGRTLFWSGLGCALVGGGGSAWLANSYAKEEKGGDVSAGDKSRTWAGVMYAGLTVGAGMMITGLVLWSSSPATAMSADKVEEAQTQFVVSPTLDGLAVGWMGSW